MRRWRGLKALIVDSVDHGSRAVEKLQIETAQIPFGILEAIPAIGLPVKGIHVVYDAAVQGTHGAIRLAARLTGGAIDVILDVVEAQGKTSGDPREGDARP